MLTLANPNDILTNFGKSIGIADIAFDQDGHCCLGFDDLVVDIAISEDNEHLIISSKIATVPVDAPVSVLTGYLSLNYIALSMGIGAIGLDITKRIVRYVDRISMHDLDDEAFLGEMTRFVNRTEKLVSWLSAAHFDNAASGGAEKITDFIKSL